MNRQLLLAVTLLLLFASSRVSAQVCTGCEVSAQVRDDCNGLLDLSSEEISDATERHLPWGTPEMDYAPSNEYLLSQATFLTWYDNDLRIPLWTAHRLTSEEEEGGMERKDCFREDSRVAASGRSTCNDYRNSGFDRGHMVPNADLDYDLASMVNSYVFSNIVPEYPSFNQGIWSYFEGRVRDWAREYDAVRIITGVVLDKNGDGHRDEDGSVKRMKNRVAIPTYAYKIVVRELQGGHLSTISILLPHVKKSIKGEWAREQYLADHIVSIDEIEEMTGFDFFPDLADQVEEEMEAAYATETWYSN